MSHLLFVIALLAAGLSSAYADNPPPLASERETLELHAHLFMKEGMTWAFRGDFDGPLQATDWTQKFSSAANPESLNHSELGIVVATLYAHPLFTLSLRESVRRQIALAEKFVATHREWIIARDAAQARTALAQGKRVMILALEGASGIIDNEQDLKEFIDDKGIRIVNLLHLTDDEYGGVAFMGGFKAFATPWARFTQLFHPTRAADGTPINANGLSDQGRAMARSLIERHVWLDFAHASDRSQTELAAMLAKNNLPLLYTHTALRKYSGDERGISREQLALVAQTDGEIGIMPSNDMLAGTVIPSDSPVHCDPACTHPCAQGIRALAQQYWEVASVLKPEQIAFGSDYNGGVRHLPPACPLKPGQDEHGLLWNIGQVGSVWDDLAQLGMPVPSPRSKMIDHFLTAWEKINPSTRTPASVPLVAIGKIVNSGTDNVGIQNGFSGTLHSDDPLVTDERIETGTEPVTILLHEGTISAAVKIKAHSRVMIKAQPGQGIQVQLESGAVLSDVHNPEKRAHPYQIRTRTAVMGVRGTVFFVKERPGQSAFLCTCHGEVELTSASAKDASPAQLIQGKHHDHPVLIQESAAEAPIAGRVTPAAKGDEHADQDAADLEKILSAYK